MSTKFQKFNKFYKNLFRLIFLATLVLVPMYWATVQTALDIFSPIGIYVQHIFQRTHELTFAVRATALGVSLIPTLAILYILAQFIKLFHCYEHLEIFSKNIVVIYRNISWAFFGYFIALIVYGPLISIALSYDNPVGKRFVTISIGNSEIFILIISGLMFLLTVVMQKAYELNENNYK